MATHIHSTDVRIPDTIDEGRLALELIDGKIESIAASVEHRTAHGLDCGAVLAAGRSWKQRRIEIEYAMKLLRGGAAPLASENDALREKLSELQARVVGMEGIIRDMRQRNKGLTKSAEELLAEPRAKIAEEKALRLRQLAEKDAKIAEEKALRLRQVAQRDEEIASLKHGRGDHETAA